MSRACLLIRLTTPMNNYFNIPKDVGYGSEAQYQLGEI